MFSDLLYTIVLFCGGSIAAASFIIKRRPDAKELIDKVLPFQGIIGIALLINGIFALLGYIWRFPFLFKHSTFWASIILLAIIVNLVLGFLLGYGILAKYILKGSDEALEKAEDIKEQLVKYQIQVGLTAIVLSLLWFLLALRIINPWVL